MREGVGAPVLVTGATGFVGSHLVERLLADGIRVRVLVRPDSSNLHRIKSKPVEIALGDLRNGDAVAEAVRDTKVIYHLAAIMSDDWETTHRVNVGGTTHLVRGALSNDVDRIVYLSDIEVYDIARSPRGSLINEDWALQTNSAQMGAYIHSRLEAERLLRAANEDHNLPVVTLRSGMVIGPRGQMIFPQLGYRWGKRFFLVLRGGTNVLPLVGVRSLVAALRAAAVSQAAVGGVFNIVDDGEITVREYLDRLSTIAETEVKVIPLPFVIPYVATLAYEFVSAVGVVRTGKTSRSRFLWKHAPVRFETRQAKEKLGWNGDMPLPDALDKAFEWYMHEIQGA